MSEVKKNVELQTDRQLMCVGHLHVIQKYSKNYLHRIEQIGSSLATLKRLQRNKKKSISFHSFTQNQRKSTCTHFGAFVFIFFLVTFDISSSWLAKCARQWTQEYVRFDGGKYAWNVLTILVELFRCSRQRLNFNMCLYRLELKMFVFFF